MSTPIFPSLPGFMFPVKRAVVWDTVKADALSGKRVRFANWTYPLYRYEIGFDFLRTDPSLLEWQTLEGFINSMQGGYGLFGFDDVNDDTATAQLFGQGDGVTTTFQLVRSLGGQSAPIFLPKLTAGLVTEIDVGGVPTVAYTVSAYGAVTFSAAPAAAASLQWTGKFYQPCRLDEDVAGFSFELQNWVKLGALKFSTEKLP